MGTFPSLDRKGYLSWKGDLVVAGIVLKLDQETLEARITAAEPQGHSLAGQRKRPSSEMCSGPSLLDPGK